jgi:hypothetical protein
LVCAWDCATANVHDAHFHPVRSKNPNMALGQELRASLLQSLACIWSTPSRILNIS